MKTAFFNSVSRHDDVILQYKDMMTKCRTVLEKL